MKLLSRLGHRRLGPSDVEVLGGHSSVLGDLYHLLLRAPWWADLLAIASVFMSMNLTFGVIYYLCGGIKGAQTFGDHFAFSVETTGTIGYGAMYPVSQTAHAVVTIHSLLGVLLVALTTGLLFAKFSVPRARMQFARHAVITMWDGVPSLMFRVGNERASQIIEAVIRVTMVITQHTKEGVMLYRMLDLKLDRERSPALSRSWTVIHRITADSPLYGATPESIEHDEVELWLSITGIDETSAQNLHARFIYEAKQVVWGARHADLLSTRDDGGLTLDIRRFHDLLPTPSTNDFPYGATGS